MSTTKWLGREIFNWLSKVIRDCFGFALLRSVIDPENSPQLSFFSKLDANELQSRLGRLRFFPRFRQFSCFHFEFSLAVVFTLVLRHSIEKFLNWEKNKLLLYV